MIGSAVQVVLTQIESVVVMARKGAMIDRETEGQGMPRYQVTVFAVVCVIIVS